MGRAGVGVGEAFDALPAQSFALLRLPLNVHSFSVQNLFGQVRVRVESL